MILSIVISLYYKNASISVGHKIPTQDKVNENVKIYLVDRVPVIKVTLNLLLALLPPRVRFSSPSPSSFCEHIFECGYHCRSTLVPYISSSLVLAPYTAIALPTNSINQ